MIDLSGFMNIMIWNSPLIAPQSLGCGTLSWSAGWARAIRPTGARQEGMPYRDHCTSGIRRSGDEGRPL